MKLYTRNGDDGHTSLFDGTRIRKDDRRIEAYGTVDELNAHIGLAIGLAAPHKANATLSEVASRLADIQRDLFFLGAELATPHESKHRAKTDTITAADVSRLEKWIDAATAAVAPLKAFILPGGDPLAAQLHVCRTVCRRAERGVVLLASQQEIGEQVLVYLNRLSDLFFAWARLANHAAGIPDEPWRGRRGNSRKQ